MTGHNPTADRSKLGTKRHILTDKNGIPLSAVISSSARTHDIRQVTDVVDNAVIHKRPSSYKTKKTVRERRRKLQHLCLDKAYNSEPEEKKTNQTRICIVYSSKREKGVKKKNKRPRLQYNIAQIGKSILQKDEL